MFNKFLRVLRPAASEAHEGEVIQSDTEEYEPYIASLFLQTGEYRSILLFALNEDDAREQIEDKFNPSKVSFIEKHKREMFQ